MIGFATPWVLAALLSLPLLWWLLRATPPAPRRVDFPALRLLRLIPKREETPVRTPWWLLLLRLAIAALAIVALAGPVLNPTPPAPGNGPLLLVVDDGWASAHTWDAIKQAAGDAIDSASRAGRPVILLTTAPGNDGAAPRVAGPLPAGEARARVDAMAPKPWAVDRATAAKALETARDIGGAVWLSDGLTSDGSDALSEQLAKRSAIVRVPDMRNASRLLRPPPIGDAKLAAHVLRASSDGETPVTVRALAADGRILGRATTKFENGAREAVATFDMPIERRNETARLEVEGENSAGATVLLDEQWRRRPVGIVRGASSEQRLLSDVYYLERALAPFAEVRVGDLGELVQRELAVLVLPDSGALDGNELTTLTRWVEQGGLLLRFAGPKLAQGGDALLPVRLRAGDRALGGSLSWSEPMKLAPFPETSPFAGLSIPGDVAISRQVLAEPAVDLAEKSWARLADGTPLVTAASRGNGRVVLVHTSAGPEWSNLALSGLYVDLLRRIVAVSAGVAASPGTQLLAPRRALDAFARLVEPDAAAVPISASAVALARAEPRHPPGLYGPEEQTRALNLGSNEPAPAPLETVGVTRAGYETTGETRLAGAFFSTALGLLVIDALVALVLGGLLTLRRPRSAVAALALLFAFSAHAQEKPAAELASKTVLAWVRTGDPTVDRTSKAGLSALARTLMQRTAIDEADAVGIDLERDELAFHPILYWPSTAGQKPLSEAARQRVNGFLRGGGLLLIDTRDGAASPSPALRAALQGVDIPPLVQAPPDHVLSKSFYLLNGFPGRYESGPLWVDGSANDKTDGVSSVVLGGADWAAAWAEDEAGRPMFAVSPGGGRQREQASRFGVNLVMYALTGNYKADQVHVPFILQRLGQ
ncbi:DUF4159 domain-containing protein [Roseiterribacter gracilis]|uniref:Double-region n=1 Tax=Roseiterribacter gracilis TaxID=2812848 RepID=A0A8S8XED2_9PROT|nr:double-region [Rhodospirillales bacterium TMPK1]